MPKDIWIISDTHFQHENILKFEPTRPGSTIQEHDEALIDNWNSVVKPGDKVYHLGDVVMGNKETFPKLWAKLHGKKRLIVGNHDNIRYLSSGAFFEKVMLWRVWKEWNMIFTHVPVSLQTLGEGRTDRDLTLNVHGHIHSNPSPVGPYRCVCVEQTNYTPINLEELKCEFNKSSTINFNITV